MRLVTYSARESLPAPGGTVDVLNIRATSAGLLSKVSDRTVLSITLQGNLIGETFEMRLTATVDGGPE